MARTADKTRTVDTIICGYEGCPVEIPARLSSWFYHLEWTHRLSNAQSLELMRERATEPLEPSERQEIEDAIWEPEAGDRSRTHRLRSV